MRDDPKHNSPTRGTRDLESSGDSGAWLDPSDTFARRHIGPRSSDIQEMLNQLGFASLDALADAAVPASIRRPGLELDFGEGVDDGRAPGEFELAARLRSMAEENEIYRSCIGMGYSDVIVPPVILRNVLENPGWYTQYTPYQSEIAQGRLEALLIFQTAISDLTALPIANASLLDEATSAAEAMGMCRSIARRRKNGFFAASNCHPQTLSVLRTRATSMGMTLHVGDPAKADFEAQELCGVLLQYPATDGRVEDPQRVVDAAHAAGAAVVMAADLLALTLLKPPGELGADIAIGSSQRFGVPLGFGGPHAGYVATTSANARKLPGRLVGISQDAQGADAYRLAIQTREQHIRREKATSNICTAQVLLAIMAAMYAVYHGPEGLRRIAIRVRGLTGALAAGLRGLGHDLGQAEFFDTLKVRPQGLSAAQVLERARARNFNLRDYRAEGDDSSVGIAFDETTTREDVSALLEIFGADPASSGELDALAKASSSAYPSWCRRESAYLTHSAFNSYHSETEMLRYLHRLESRDLSLTSSIIPLGSCTMKLNATALMAAVTWPEFGRLHPNAPAEQWRGYAKLFEQLESWLAEITSLPAVSLQPNAGSQGEYAGLLAIRRYFDANGQPERRVCLIPGSAHGTNAASAVIAGFHCVAVACDDRGNVDLGDLRAKSGQHADKLGALMITYPSTHGVFEESAQEICQIVHDAGGQVYMDGANMNAQVGLTSPAQIGADVCHLNLHKTFAIPHGGGGPGMGPIAAREHLRAYLPGDPIGGEGAISAARYGSAGILPISWMYIALLGSAGLTKATQVAILNANYMAMRLSEQYEVLYTGPRGQVAHEFIIECRDFEHSTGVTVEDIAKRLMDFGFHAPTMSFPVAGTLMIEPTESESRAELDRLCDALIIIRDEIRAIETGQLDRQDNPLKNAPHTAAAVTHDEWTHSYTRAQAAYPTEWVKQHKFWPAVGRIDNTFGDRNLIAKLT